MSCYRGVTHLSTHAVVRYRMQRSEVHTATVVQAATAQAQFEMPAPGPLQAQSAELTRPGMKTADQLS
jgi:hypothetical protein